MSKNKLQDIQSRKDLEYLIDEFYKTILKDKVIGHFFTEVVVLDWEKHIPVMYSFWETLLLDNMTYKGNPILKHIELNQKQKLQQIHFDQWLKLWSDTVNKNFSGPKASLAISKANQIGSFMKYKIDDTANSII